MAQKPKPKYDPPVPPPKGSGGIGKPGITYKKTAGGLPIKPKPKPTGDAAHDKKMSDAYDTLYGKYGGQHGPKPQPDNNEPLYGTHNPKGMSAVKPDTTAYVESNYPNSVQPKTKQPHNNPYPGPDGGYTPTSKPVTAPKTGIDRALQIIYDTPDIYHEPGRVKPKVKPKHKPGEAKAMSTQTGANGGFTMPAPGSQLKTKRIPHQ